MTPVTPIGITRYDGYSAVEAAIMAWTMKGTNPDWHDQMKRQVAIDMPLLTRALNRMSQEYPHGLALEWAKKADARGITIVAGSLICPNLEHEDYDLVHVGVNFRLEDVVLYVKEHYDCEPLPNRSING